MTFRLPARSLAVRVTPKDRMVLSSPDRAVEECSRDVIEWGSITKVLTAQAIAALRADGLISQCTVLGDILPPSPAADRRLSDVVSHKAGLPRMHAGAARGVFSDPCRPFDTHQPVERMLDRLGEVRRPGEHRYSNLGYALLGSVIERVAEASWRDAVINRLLPESLHVTLQPAADRRCLPRDVRGRRREPWSLSTGNYAPAGGLWSTVDGLAVFGRDQLDRGIAFARESGWTQLSDSISGVNGRTRDTDVSVVLDRNSGSVVVVHSLRVRPGVSWKAAQALTDHVA